MRLRTKILAGFVVAFVVASLALERPARADIFDVTIRGSDAIFLAGRSDVTIPAANLPWTGPPGGFLTRHLSATPEEIQETFPPSFAVSGGDVVRALDLATGGISFFNGFGNPLFGPGGNGTSGSNLQSLGGISGYLGPQGPLVGVFLDNSVPSAGPPPATLDFTPGGLGTNFPSLSPLLRQVFYIGDGVTGSNVFQQFIAPAGATRLFLGIPDGFGFVGAPGAYDDNDGSYQIRIGINQVPTVPEPSSAVLFAVSMLATAYGWTRRQRAQI